MTFDRTAGDHRFAFRREVFIPLSYKGRRLDTGYKLDLIVEECVIVELKAVTALNKVHVAQLLTYLKLTGLKLGLLINFGSALIKHGIFRLVNGL